MKKTLLASALLAVLATATAQANDTTDELRNTIEKQQQVLNELAARLNQTEQRLEATAAHAESSSAVSNTTIGGYGEMHYNDIGDQQTLDFHRFVLYVGHEFNSKTRLYSELEVEHGFIQGGKGGEVALEQAYIEHDFTETTSAQAGMFLMPVGIINETHEPTTFYGVERNPVEKNIIPTTWREGGVKVSLQLQPGLTVDGAVTSGLNVPTDGGSAYKVRNGRQGLSEANADSLAYTGRIKYTAINGLELAATLHYQSDVTQGLEEVSATLIEAHAIYQMNNFKIKALYASWDIDSDAAKALGRDQQQGFYIEPSYQFNEQIGVFARYNEYDNNAGIHGNTEKRQTNVGVNYWLTDGVVLKADIEKQTGASDSDGFNLGIGYQF